MRIYTRTGDDGQTGLPDGQRIRKDDDRLEAVGTIDELNCALGIVRSCELAEPIDGLVEEIQSELFQIGAELAVPAPGAPDCPRITRQHVEKLEAAIDRFSETLEPLQQFILPGGCPGAAALHAARSICRRAERRLVRLTDAEGERFSAVLTSYLNRLGDLLFVLARAANARAGLSDVPWQKPR